MGIVGHPPPSPTTEPSFGAQLHCPLLITLETIYVSRADIRRALSWYFLNLFGLNGVFKLILGNNNGRSPPLCTPFPYILLIREAPQS